MTKEEKLIQIAKTIEEAMILRGLKKQELAYIMNVSPSAITKWLSGEHNFTLETLFGIEEKLGIKLIHTCETKSTIIKYTYVENPNRGGFISCA